MYSRSMNGIQSLEMNFLLLVCYKVFFLNTAPTNSPQLIGELVISTLASTYAHNVKNGGTPRDRAHVEAHSEQTRGDTSYLTSPRTDQCI